MPCPGSHAPSCLAKAFLGVPWLLQKKLMRTHEQLASDRALCCVCGKRVAN
jgi:hypothetical protein